MLDEFTASWWSSNVLKLRESDLSNDGTKLAAGRGNTVGSGTVTGGEGFTRNHESGGVRPKVLEEVGEAVKHNETLFGGRSGVKFVKAEA